MQNPKQIQAILNAQSLLKAPNHRGDKIVLKEDTMYLITQRIGGRFWHLMQQSFSNSKMESKNNIYMLVSSKGIKSELYTLLGVIFASFIAALLAISLVAYFLVSLSLKPLKEKSSN